MLIIILLVLVLWFISDSLKAREAAHASARKACEEAGVQFLDDTVSLMRLRMTRDRYGRAILARWFRFEFSVSGDDRKHGTVRLLGNRAQEVNLDKLWVVQ